MALSFPLNNAPFGLLALANALKAPSSTLALSPVPVETSTATTLVTKDSVKAVKITGVVPIARFLVRAHDSSNTFYPESSDVANYTAQDQLLDIVRQTIATPKHLTTLATAADKALAATGSFLLSKEQPQLCDYAVWGMITAYTKSHSLLSNLKDLEKFMAWMARMDERAECKEAISTMDKALEEAKETLAKEAAAAAAERALSSAVIEVPTIEGSDPVVDPLDEFKNVMAFQLSKLVDVDIKILYDALEAPRAAENGHIALSVPRLRLKGKDPIAVAAEIVDKFPVSDYVTLAKADGPFVNFFLNHVKLAQSLFKRIYETKERWGGNNTGAGKKVIVEFSSPNIAKPFHAGHLRSTIIGSFVRNILDANGYDTTSMNYLGDWGKQYGLLAIGFERYGSEEKLLADPIKHLFDVYVQINVDAKENEAVHDEARAYFKKMEDGDEAALKNWSRFRNLSIVKYKDIYARLNIAFDVYSGESQVTDGMERALKLLHEKKLLTESDGALIVDLTKYKLGICVVQKKDGTTLYITRDIGAALERYEKYGFEHMYYIVASQQDLHLKQLFKILELLGFDWAKKVTHLNFGMVGGMSTRKGTVVFLEDILEETRDSMHEVMKKNEHKYAQIENPLEVADNIGIAAIMIQDASARRVKNYDFDWKRMFSFEGDTGPYLQYAHARLCSIERKTEMEVNPNADLTALDDERACADLITMIARYPQIVRETTRSFEPVNIVGYAMKLSHNVSQALETMYVMGAEKNKAEARLFMYWSARITLGNAMRLLNLKPQERM
ncbi:arginyl-tRNA synthetase [Entomortierella parvispora]|uniref:arginine--tRNA ligase n=1 Tax=Entomortierella parvispora TaxID=205924 RepID=A0A9P3LW86_9FUNG|nr:arginyl-tRNA synthetase [Entomortierella parvispora]